MFDKIIEMIQVPFKWVDRILTDFEWYSAGWAKWFVYAIVMVALSKVLKVNVKVAKG